MLVAALRLSQTNIIIIGVVIIFNLISLLTAAQNYKKKTKYGSSIPKIKMKKALRETQTLRACCSKAEPKISAPPQTPFPGAQYGQNLISWRWSLLSSTDPVW